MDLNKKRRIGNVRGRGWLSQYVIKCARRASLKSDFEPRLQGGEKVINRHLQREPSKQRKNQ